MEVSNSIIFIYYLHSIKLLLVKTKNLLVTDEAVVLFNVEKYMKSWSHRKIFLTFLPDYGEVKRRCNSFGSLCVFVC